MTKGKDSLKLYMYMYMYVKIPILTIWIAEKRAIYKLLCYINRGYVLECKRVRQNPMPTDATYMYVYVSIIFEDHQVNAFINYATCDSSQI